MNKFFAIMKTTQINSILMFLAIITMLSSCQEKKIEENNDEIINVKTAPVVEVFQSMPIQSSGQLSSKTESKLSFKTGGIIRNIYVDEGVSVKQGTLLASLDLEEIDAQVKQARLGYEKSKRDLRRVENLYHDSVATLENFQDATTALELAESNMTIAEFNLQYSKIIAPSDGKILKKLASVNELVSSGMPVFIFAPSTENMVVRVNLTDKDIVRVNINDSCIVSFDAYPGEEFRAKITEIANAADPYTGTYEVELQLEHTAKKLVSGFIAKVLIFPSLTKAYYEVPVDALIEGRGSEGFLYVVKDGKANSKKIVIKRIVDDKLIISEGIEAGELVITEGSKYIDENSTINIVN